MCVCVCVCVCILGTAGQVPSVKNSPFSGATEKIGRNWVIMLKMEKRERESFSRGPELFFFFSFYIYLSGDAISLILALSRSLYLSFALQTLKNTHIWGKCEHTSTHPVHRHNTLTHPHTNTHHTHLPFILCRHLASFLYLGKLTPFKYALPFSFKRL